MPLGSSSAAPVMRPGPTRANSAVHGRRPSAAVWAWWCVVPGDCAVARYRSSDPHPSSRDRAIRQGRRRRHCCRIRCHIPLQVRPPRCPGPYRRDRRRCRAGRCCSGSGFSWGGVVRSDMTTSCGQCCMVSTNAGTSIAHFDRRRNHSHENSAVCRSGTRVCKLGICTGSGAGSSTADEDTAHQKQNQHESEAESDACERGLIRFGRHRVRARCGQGRHGRSRARQARAERAQNAEVKQFAAADGERPHERPTTS